MVEHLIRRARQRYLVNEALAQAAFAAVVAISGVVLLLILGTRYFGWWAMALLAAAGIAFGIFRVYRQTPDAYGTAIRVDENAGLHDALSTALYFSGHHEGSEAFRRSQRQQAEAAAGAVTLERAVPFIIPRALYAMAALGVLASGLVALRHQLGLGLDPRSPIMQALLKEQAAGNPKQEVKKADPKQWMQEAQALLSRLGVKSDGHLPQDDQAELDKALDQALRANPGAKDQKSGANPAEDAKKPSDSGDPIELASQDRKDDSAAMPQVGKTNAIPGQEESLLDKLKQAVSSLISKEKEPSDSSQQQGQPEDENLSSDMASVNKEKPGENMSAAMEGGETADQAKGGQRGQLDANEVENGQGSGIGAQDGVKERREAEQLKAMGKISEIIGKRSATISGDMMVEVQSSKNQPLHTAYTNTAAAHGEAEGEVTRDEIPLSLQPYVQQYFEQVRKAPAPNPAAQPKSTR